VVSIALTYNDEPVDPCAKDFIQFSLANTGQQFLQPREQMFFVHHLDIFQFFLTVRNK
jgi:hypothetical protein